MTLAKVVLVGAHGYGRSHLENLRQLESAGIARLAGVCDVTPVDPEILGGAEVPQSSSLEELLDDVEPAVVIVATPIHTHVDLAVIAMRAGSAVLLEKPPAPSLAEFQRLLDVSAATGRPCQVGFQSLGSAAVDRARALITSGRIGELRGIGGAGTWIREASYYARAAWAGRRRLDGRPVIDGVLTNPFAHAVATALRLAACESAETVIGIETELFHAHPIEADDTSSIRITTTSVPITIATTLCARTNRDPYLVAHGTDGSLVLRYTRDELTLHTADGVESFTDTRVDLLTNLIAHLADPATPLLVPAASAAAFMEFVDAIRRAPDPRPVPLAHQEIVGDGPQLRRIITGIDDVVEKAAETMQLFSELGMGWAEPDVDDGAGEPGRARPGLATP